MDGSPALSRMITDRRSEAEALAEFDGLPAVWPRPGARHQCGHDAAIVIFLRWAARQPRSFTDADVPWIAGGAAKAAHATARDNGYLEAVTYSRHPVSGLLVDHWQISARGRAVVERAAAFERDGRVF